MNSWRPNIVWELTASGRANIPFLDLSLSIVNNRIVYQTHRKPLNAYLYLSRVSTHPTQTFVGLLKGETNRLVNTNSTRSTLHKHLNFFTDKPVQRGYSKFEVAEHIRGGLRSARLRRERLAERRSGAHRSVHRSHYLKLTYGSSCNVSCIKGIIHRHRHLISSIARVGVSFGVQRNRFRQLYRLNWPSRWS